VGGTPPGTPPGIATAAVQEAPYYSLYLYYPPPRFARRHEWGLNTNGSALVLG